LPSGQNRRLALVALVLRAQKSNWHKAAMKLAMPEAIRRPSAGVAGLAAMGGTRKANCRCRPKPVVDFTNYATSSHINHPRSSEADTIARISY